MISNKLLKAINAQINAEMWSAYLYLSMAQYAYTKGFVGASNWFTKQFAEEQGHAMKFISYLRSQNERAILDPIASVPAEWNSVLDAFKDTLKHEIKVTEMINNLVDIASKDNDYAAQNMLAWFIDEQIEEEKSVQVIIEKLSFMEGDKVGLYMIDKELGTRE
ncbi:MAG: ferritin [Phocaeicola sp.]|uniref:ferritin n=1 Tax=Phocaeicola TaxID=909656 RepID=UPI00234EF077|nr:ferritin [Phocaeicola oris]MCE2615510.1 ferritin [Phocaeicola oris]